MNDRKEPAPEFFTDLTEFCARFNLPAPSPEALQAAKERRFRLPSPLLDRIALGDPLDPVLRQFLPQGEELRESDGFSTDPLQERSGPNEESESAGVDDSAHSPILRKYYGRALLLTGGICAGNCRFCFRRHFPVGSGLFGPGRSLETVEKRLAALLAPLAADRTLTELILSGSDPMGLPEQEIELLLDYIRKMPYVNRVRIHTRFPVLIPERISERFLNVIRPADENNHQRYIFVFHINHPAEISPLVASAFARLRGVGATLLVQSVLLAGVNDDAAVLAALYEKLADCGVLPYYLHQLDRVAGAAHFEVPEERGLALIEALRERLPGYLVPRYVREIPNRPAKTPLS